MNYNDVLPLAWPLGDSNRYGAAAERHVLGKGSGGPFFDPHGGPASGLINGLRLVWREKRRVVHRTEKWSNP